MSSRQSNSVFCAIRKELVKQTPEERVRQSTLSSLVSLGYPTSLMVVERKIADLPHLATSNVKMPNRRVDIICYEGKSLKPLLLIECKAVSYKDKELRQLLGYNFYIQAKYIALVAENNVHLYDVQSGQIYSHFLPYKS